MHMERVGPISGGIPYSSDSHNRLCAVEQLRRVSNLRVLVFHNNERAIKSMCCVAAKCEGLIAWYGLLRRLHVVTVVVCECIRYITLRITIYDIQLGSD